MKHGWIGFGAGVLCGILGVWARPSTAQEPPGAKPMIPGHYVVFEIPYTPASASTKTPSGKMRIDPSMRLSELEALEEQGWMAVHVEITDTTLRVLARGNP